jgi:hypothetical protein
MITFNRAVFSTATIALGIGLAVTPASPSVAAPPPAAPAIAAPPSSCANQSVCGYVNIDFRTDQGYEWIPVQNGGTCVIVSHRNAWSGVYNNSGRTIRMYRNTGCTGTDYKTITNGDWRNRFSLQLGPSWDNSVDAIKFI